MEIEQNDRRERWCEQRSGCNLPSMLVKILTLSFFLSVFCACIKAEIYFRTKSHRFRPGSSTR